MPTSKKKAPSIPKAKTLTTETSDSEEDSARQKPLPELRIYTTGIREGETITSAPGATQNAGTVMQIKGFYPPSEKALADLNAAIVRDTFNQYAFFRSMLPSQRLEWLQQNATDNNDLYMEDVELKIKFVAINGKFMLEALGQANIDMLLAGKCEDDDDVVDAEGFWDIKYVYNLFPRKQGSKAKKHTLIFRPHNWRLMPSLDKPSSFEGLYYDLDSCEVKEGKIAFQIKGLLEVYKVEKLMCGLDSYAIYATQTRTTPLSWEGLCKLVGKRSQTMNKIKPLLEWFPPSLHKSLLQKLIRTRCVNVVHQNTKYSARSVVLTSLCLLLLHSGSFVPNINRYVSGLESAFKRMAVSINEDSYFEDGNVIALFYACATLAQQNKIWRPSDKILKTLLETAVIAQQESRLFKYDWHSFTECTCKNEWSFCYICLGEIGSFESDVRMVGSIANNEGKAKTTVYDTVLFSEMPLSWCIDQHTFTEIAYYLPYTGEDFSIIFKGIWNKATGVNPRSSKYQDWTGQEQITLDIKAAQELVWLAKTHTPDQRSIVEDTFYDFKFTLHDSWLAGLIGPIEVKVGKIKALVVLRCDDITTFTAVRKPLVKKRASKKQKEEEENVPPLSSEEIEEAMEKALILLRKGIDVKNVPSTLSNFQGIKVYLQGEEDMTYVLRLDKKNIDWNKAKVMRYKLPLHPSGECSIKEALLYVGEGIMEHAEEKFLSLLQELKPVVLRRVLMYLEGTRSVIALHKISRDGSSQELKVMPEDSLVFVFLCQVCCLYPAALRKTVEGFKVMNGPLLWSLREKLVSYARREVEAKSPWTKPTKDTRSMWEHQQDILAQLKNRYRQNKHGSLIWSGTGTGKTMCVTNFIHWLIRKKGMPPYCVWVLPPSAIKTIGGEMELGFLPYQIIDMRAKGVNKKLKRGVVNIIRHDHMRLNGMEEQLKEKASNMLFVIDEFHKAMNKTIRTSIAMEVVKLSAHFVGLSATLVTGDPDDLIPWLEFVVEFEVTKNNYFVAMAALISKKIQLPIEIIREAIEVPMLNQEEYYKVVPSNLGGTAKSLNLKQALKYCYDSIIVELVDMTVKYVREGEGVFIMAKDKAQQVDIRDQLKTKGVKKIHLIDNDNPVNMRADDTSGIQVVITTKQHTEGYTLVKMRIYIASLVLCNQCTRDQVEGRLVRIGQQSPFVRFITLHCGILSYIMERYRHAKHLSEIIKDFAADIGLDAKEVYAQM